MKTLEERIKNITEDGKKKVEKLIQAETIKVEVMKTLNLKEENFAPGFIHASYANCNIEFDAESLIDALTLAERMNPLALVHYQKGEGACLAFRPLTEDMKDDHFTLVGGYVYELKCLDGYPVKKHLKFFVNAGKYKAAVRIHVESDPLTDARGYKTKNPHYPFEDMYIQHLKNDSGYFPKSTKWWTTPNTAANYTLYA